MIKPKLFLPIAAVILCAAVLAAVLISGNPERVRQNIAVGFLTKLYSATYEEGKALVNVSPENASFVIESSFQERYGAYLTENCMDGLTADRTLASLALLAYQTNSNFSPETPRTETRSVKNVGAYDLYYYRYSFDLVQTDSQNGRTVQIWPVKVDVYLLQTADGWKIDIFRLINRDYLKQ